MMTATSVLVLAALQLAAAANSAGVHQLPDPTKPPRAHASAVKREALLEPEHFELSAVKLRAGTDKALINGRLVGVGDAIGDATILEINSQGVRIEYLSEEQLLTLTPGTIRRPAERADENKAKQQ